MRVDVLDGNKIPTLANKLSKWELFSTCGETDWSLVAGWLRVTGSNVKRQAEKIRWDDWMNDGTPKMMKDIIKVWKRKDLVKGKWQIPEVDEGIVWSDVSSIAIGAALEVEVSRQKMLLGWGRKLTLTT